MVRIYNMNVATSSLTLPEPLYLPSLAVTTPPISLSLFLQPNAMNSNNKSNPNPNPFPWGIGWRAFFLGCSLGDRTKFENTMKVCSNFSSMEDLHKESDDVVKKAMSKELKTLIPDPAKGVVSVDILRWVKAHLLPWWFW